MDMLAPFQAIVIVGVIYIAGVVSIIAHKIFKDSERSDE